SREQAERVQSCRELCLSYEEEGTTGELDGRLPAAEMAVVQARLEQVASTLPVMPGEQDRSFTPPGWPMPWWRCARERVPGAPAPPSWSRGGLGLR
ncbi:MAG TPA: hypothetical protein VE646_13835, partial [Actinomycetota bacterium]|nr:hypothetical protein [Actinomycetota bacterium]